MQSNTGRSKFIIGGVLILAAVVYLIFSSTQANAQYYVTIGELQEKRHEIADRELRISGAVLGESIQYDPQSLTLQFTVVHMPGDNKQIDAEGGLATVLHNAVNDPTLPRMDVIYVGVRPDLLQHEAQAIMTGKLGDDGFFYADELLLKCPTKYEEAIPDQAEG
jgi:cytochrome c-type biogenesis protein CcmE